MNIQRLTIKNFRSIGPEGIDISFDTNLTALVGRNNVGKTNIIRALELIVGGYWPMEGRFQIEDFYNKNIQNGIEICVYFREPLDFTTKVESWYEHKAKVYGFKLEYKTYKRTTEHAEAGELHLDYSCINATGAAIRIPTKAPRRDKPHEFKSSFTNVLKVNRQLRDQVQAIFIPVDRNVLSYSPSKSRSVLGILFKKVTERFLDSRETLNVDEDLADKLGIHPHVTRKELFESYMTKANETLKTEELNEISEAIEKYLVEHIGEHEAEGIRFDFQIQDVWNQYKNIALILNRNDITLPADRLGHGFQSLIVLAIFRTYLELKEQKAIFLMEEPEMFLHTHAKKYFYSVLQKLASSGTQIILSTHATEFVDLLNYKNVKRVVIEHKSTRVYPLDVVDLDFNEDELLKLNTAINNERAELFFAEKVLLVEGETEKVVYDYLLKSKGVDPNLNNISVIETSGKGSMPRYIVLLQSLRIPFVVIHDSDLLPLTGDEAKDKRIRDNNSNAESKNRAIKETIEDKANLFVFDPYFEIVAGITDQKHKKKDSKPVAAIAHFRDLGDYSAMESTLPDIVRPINRILHVR